MEATTNQATEVVAHVLTAQEARILEAVKDFKMMKDISEMLETFSDMFELAIVHNSVDDTNYRSTMVYDYTTIKRLIKGIQAA